jgi:hypothetical protein
MNNIIKITLIGFLILFSSLLLAENFGYYKTKEEKVKILTDEQIKKFEEDVKNKKNIDIKEYVNYESEDYSNNLSNNIYKVSLKLENVFDSAIKIVFNSVGKMVND